MQNYVLRVSLCMICYCVGVSLCYRWSLCIINFTHLFQLVAWACYITGSFWRGAITCEIHSYKSSCRVPENACRYMGHSEKFIYWRTTWGSFDGIFFFHKLYLILECLIINSVVYLQVLADTSSSTSYFAWSTMYA